MHLVLRMETPGHRRFKKSQLVALSELQRVLRAATHHRETAQQAQ